VLAVTTTLQLPAGSHPVMIAGNPSNNKIFVINQGNGTVTEISTVDNTITNTFTVGTSPVWGVMSTDGLFVFVVNQGSGTVSVIDASLDAIVPCAGASCPSGNAIVVGPSPNFAFYESKLRRVYVSNTGNNSVSVIAANGINTQATPPVLPVKLKDITLSGAPTSVTALSDGTKAYAALGNCPAGVNHTTIISVLQTPTNCTGNLVSVIDAVALQETGTITVGPGAIAVDSSPDASKVYAVSARDITTIRDNVNATPQPNRTFPTPAIYVIPTSTNVPLVTPVDPSVVSSPLPTFHVPQQDPNCVPAIDPSFNSKVPQPCLLQTPFVVRTFP
jgi:YVTN family beta-propeller protein